jgi:hypothetical protein
MFRVTRAAVQEGPGTRIPGDRGTAALGSALVRKLPRHLGDDDGASAAQLGTAVLDLLIVMLAARIRQEPSAPPPARQRALLASVHAFIEEAVAGLIRQAGLTARGEFLPVG